MRIVSETWARSSLFGAGLLWPPDDVEESIVGTDLHQRTITNLRLGINECAESARLADEPAPWQALSQIVLLGCRRLDGTEYKTMPDIFVYPRPIDINRGSLALALDGPPALVIEVLSESTYSWDIDLERGKGYTYAQAGVREYLTIDVGGAFLPEGIRAWRLRDRVYQPWLPELNGRWRSAEIGVSIGLEGVQATVYDAADRSQLREGEIGRELARRDAELAALRKLVEELRKP
jgi:hypothetical protein